MSCPRCVGTPRSHAEAVAVGVLALDQTAPLPTTAKVKGGPAPAGLRSARLVLAARAGRRRRQARDRCGSTAWRRAT